MARLCAEACFAITTYVAMGDAADTIDTLDKIRAIIATIGQSLM